MIRYQYIAEEDWPRILAEVNKLDDILMHVRPEGDCCPPGYENKRKGKLAANKDFIDCSEVYPNVLIGDGITAKKKKYLKRIGVTHVLNAAMGTAACMINTHADYYAREGIRFMGIYSEDTPSFQISVNFEAAAKFIDDALQSGGRVYVHCVGGVSRSAACVMAFLMIKRSMTVETALRTLRSKRRVAPNLGFLAQLVALEFKLREENADYPSHVNGTEMARTGAEKMARKCAIL